MKKVRILLSKLLISIFVFTNIFAVLPTVSFAAKEDKKDIINYEARAKSEIIVKFKDGKNLNNVRGAVKGKLKLSKLDSKISFKKQKIDVLEIGSGDNLEIIIQELQKNPDVEYAHPNYKLEATAAPADIRLSEQWGLLNNGQNVEGKIGRSGVDIKAIEAWNLEIGDPTVVVGVMDTGIDIYHDDLKNNIFINTGEIAGNSLDDDNNGYVDDVNGWDFANDDKTVYDSSQSDRHGTYAAGAIAASSNSIGISGVAPGVKILPLKFINGESGYTCDAIKAIEYAMDMNVGIINCSFGGTDNNLALKDSMRNSGILFVCAAGNRGGNIAELPFYPSCFNIPNILSVAAVDGNGVLAPFSSYGDIIHVAAPGTNILSTTPENTYDYFSGTSVAAPLVAGVAALVKSYLPNSSISDITGRIKNNVVPCTNLQGKLTTGGRVNAFATLTNIKPANDTYTGEGQNIDTISVGNQGGDIDTWYTQDQLAKIREMMHYGESGVNPASGNYSFSCNDMSIPAPGFQVNISRSYNSRDDKNSPMGRGWTFGFEGSAMGTDVVVVTLPSGAVQRFRLLQGKYEAEDSRSVFIKNADNSSVLTTKDQYTYGFNSNGWLVWMKDRNGNTVNIAVDGNGKIAKITDTVGREYIVQYNVRQLIDNIKDPENRVVRYEYDAYGLLIKVIDPMGSIMRYSYDSYGFIDKIEDHYVKPIVSLAYNHGVGANQHKVAEVTDQNGHKSNYSYDSENKKTTITDVNGRSWSYWFDATFYTVKTQDPDGKFTYTEYYMPGGKNKYGDVKSTTDRNGNKTEYEIDDRGNVIKIKNPDGGEKTYSFDEKNNLTSEKDELGKKIDYTYEDGINLSKKARVDGFASGTTTPSSFAVTSYAYYTKAEALSLFNCSANGLLKSVTNPLGNVTGANVLDYTTTYKYNQYGDIVEEKNPGMNPIISHFNKIGWKDYSISPGGHRTDYVYDLNGQLEKVFTEESETTRIVYDMAGRKIQEISPNLFIEASDDIVNHKYNNSDTGTRYEYYDNGKLKTIKNALNYTTTYHYDVYGNLIKVVRHNGSILGYVYDNMDRVIREYYKDSETSPEQLMKEYSYSILSDKQTQKTEKVYFNDMETASSVYVYDYAGRMIEQQNPDGTKVKTEYDLNGNVKSSTGVNGSTVVYKYDDLNRLVKTWTPLEISNGNTYYSYSEIGYDKADRKQYEKTSTQKVLLEVEPSNKYSVDYTYYNNNKVESITDSDGRKTKFWYDDDLNVSREDAYISTTAAIKTEYVYNHLNKIEDKKLYVNAGDLTGNDFSSTVDTVLLTHYTYDKNGNVKTVTDPNLVTTVFEYDALNQIITTSQPAINENEVSMDMTNSTKYDWEGKVVEKTDPLGKRTYYSYNPQGFLTAVEDAMGGKSAFDYDRAGRKINEISPENYVAGISISEMSRSEYTYDVMSRTKAKREVYKDNQGNWHDFYSKLYKYDNSGNVIKELDALGYESGTGTTVDEKIDTGYGTEYIYNFASLISMMTDPVSKERTLSYALRNDYDGMGRKISETNSNGVITKYELDSAGNTLNTKVQKSSSASLILLGENTYDLKGRLLTKTDGNRNTTLFEYNAFNQVRMATYPGDTTIPANVVQYQYDVLGNIKKQQDSMGKVLTYLYDNQGRILSQTESKLNDDTQSITVSNKYDLNGNVRFNTDGEQHSTEFIYDDLNRLKTEKIQVNGIWQATNYGYDDNGNQTTITNWLNNTSKNIYDPLNRLVEIQDANTVTVQKLEYNNNSVQVKSYDALGYVTSYEYDKNNRLIASIDPENHTTSQYYDNDGNVLSKTDGRNNATNYSYDELSRLVEVINSRSEKTSYIYDLNGNMLSQTDGRGYVTSYEYNAANKLTRKINDGGRLGAQGNFTYLDEKVESYTYYTDGSLKTKKDRNGKTTMYEYDIHGRLTSQTIEAETIAYTYDRNGNERTMTDSTGLTERTYDELNRVESKTVPGFGTTIFEYDIITGVDTGFVKEKTSDFKGNVTEKVMDRVGRLSAVISDGQTTTYGYYLDGSRQYVQYPNNDREDYTYYKNKLVWTLTNKDVNGAVIDSYSYTYDAANNQSSKQDGKGTTYYSYDSLNRLDSTTEPDGKRTTYIFDKSGNRASESVTFGASIQVTVYTYDEQNRLTLTQTQTNGVLQESAYDYDANGNMVIKTQSSIKPGNGVAIPSFKMEKAGTYQNTDATFYEYDKWNQLIKATESYNTATYKYNGDGLRVEKAKTELITLLSDDFSGGLDKWTSTSNATISNGQMKVVNNENMRSASTDTARWDDFIMEVDVKVENTSAGLVFRNNGNNGYFWQFSTESGGKLKQYKIVNGATTVLKEVLLPIVQNVWYHMKVQANGSTIKTFVDGVLVDTTTDTTYSSGNVGFRQTGTAMAVFDNYTLVLTGVTTRSTTRYLYESDKVILETDANGNQTARNIYGTNLLVRTTGSETLYYMYNGHADVTALIKADGTIAATYYYDAFGTIVEQTGDTNNSINYAGYQYDTETGLYYLNARYYDSKIARFLSEDTYRGQANDPLSLNLYTYCHNEPIMYIDPTGHMNIVNGHDYDADKYGKDSIVYNKLEALTAQYNKATKVEKQKIANKAKDLRAVADEQIKLNSLGYEGKDGKTLVIDGIKGSNTNYAMNNYVNSGNPSSSSTSRPSTSSVSMKKNTEKVNSETDKEHPGASDPKYTEHYHDKLFGTVYFAKIKGSRKVELDAKWVDENIEEIDVPIALQGGLDNKTMWVHKDTIKNWEKAFELMQKEYEPGKKYIDLVKTCTGNYTPRYMADSSKSLSNHSFGTALDINAGLKENVNYYDGAKSIESRKVASNAYIYPLYEDEKQVNANFPIDQDINTQLANYKLFKNVFKPAGFGWGMNYEKINKSDGMHFEVKNPWGR